MDASEERAERMRKAKPYNLIALISFAACILLFLMGIWTGVGEFGATGGILLFVPIIAKLTAWKVSGGFEDFMDNW